MGRGSVRRYLLPLRTWQIKEFHGELAFFDVVVRKELLDFRVEFGQGGDGRYQPAVAHTPLDEVRRVHVAEQLEARHVTYTVATPDPLQVVFGPAVLCRRESRECPTQHR